MSVDDIVSLLKETEHNGYPVVVSKESQYLVGFVLRRDLNLAIGKCGSFANLSENPNYCLSNKTPFRILQQMVDERLTAFRDNRWFYSHRCHPFKISAHRH